MHRLADDVHHLPVLPRGSVNTYLVGDVLVDTGMRFSGGRILKELVGYPVSAVAITHAHIDHVGSARQVSQALDVPVWASTADAPAVESGRPPIPPGIKGPEALVQMVQGFPGVPVARRLSEGDEVAAGFVVLDTPGHTDGHIALWRESDRTLICGDVCASMNIYTGMPGLNEMPSPFIMDKAVSRESIRRIAALEPALLLPGHGMPWRDPAALGHFAARLGD